MSQPLTRRYPGRQYPTRFDGCCGGGGVRVAVRWRPTVMRLETLYRGTVVTCHAVPPPRLHLVQLDAIDASKGSLEMNPHWFAYNRHIAFGRAGSWWEVPLDARLGLTYAGAAPVECGVVSRGSCGRLVEARQTLTQPSPQPSTLTQAARCWRSALAACPWRWHWRPACWRLGSPFTLAGRKWVACSYGLVAFRRRAAGGSTRCSSG